MIVFSLAQEEFREWYRLWRHRVNNGWFVFLRSRTQIGRLRISRANGSLLGITKIIRMMKNKILAWKASKTNGILRAIGKPIAFLLPEICE
ncbi:hypothetical protein FCV82_05250 [Vibrio breoganii]|uniref:Uncharacterized protein n=1 Tax=Vibrio breoganii TaxID=553239 RepID=A0ABX1U724_9VIBR|nr:hypothetical protein [Vibrio breoganii]NMR70257.1 hypothetical protein [Vibrio breoganii]OCH73421.1 hypothetical protein A6D95_03775 [Vibrio breoganii]PMG05396.1 hypothetical protein BCV02_04530 [Vibrio breoganii]PMG05765.1 hypothetical protein BCV00_11955 [Vibrio breoganii]